jgi:hypothetical protein
MHTNKNTIYIHTNKIKIHHVQLSIISRVIIIMFGLNPIFLQLLEFNPLLIIQRTNFD